MFTERRRKEEVKASKIEDKIRRRLQHPKFAQAGLYLKEVIPNPSNRNQFLAHFDIYDKGDNKNRKHPISISKLAENLTDADIDQIINSALERCNQDLVAIYVPAFMTS